MKTGRYLLIVAVSLPRWIAAAELDFPGSDVYSPGDYNTADRVQRNVSESVNIAAQWIDSFFDDERFIAEDATTKIRLRQSVFLEHDESPEHKTKFSLSIDIPKTKKRLRVFIASEDDTNKTPDGRAANRRLSFAVAERNGEELVAPPRESPEGTSMWDD